MDANWNAFSSAETVDIGYDASGLQVSLKLSRSGTVYALSQASYDANGRLLCSAVRMNPAIYGSLPPSACLLGAQGADGPDRIGQISYDAAGNVIKAQEGVGTSDAVTERTLTYTNNGKVLTLKDAENNLTTYTYDGFDRLTKTQFPSPTKGSGTSSTTDYEQLSYDLNGNVTSQRLRDGNSIAFNYDALDRVTLKDLPGSEPDVSYGYDNLGRLTSASQTGNNLTFTYDALGRNLTQVGPQGTMTSAWDLAGRRAQLTYPGGGLSVTYNYLTTGDISQIVENGTASLASYVYDNLGNRTSVTFGNGVVQTYAYDPVSRLTGLTNDLPGTMNDQTIGTIAYDARSGIRSAPRSNDAYSFAGYYAVNRPYTSNGLNQYTAAGAATFSYDSKGNLTSDGTNSYTYSSENLLISAPSNTNLAYDPFARLFQVTGTSTTRFAYDGLDLIAEYDGTNALQRRFVFGLGTDEPIVWYEGSGLTDRRFLSSDERGSITSVTDNVGSVVAINSYDEYGIPGTSNLGRFQYTGQAWLPEIGMYYYKARFYSPTLGRFMQTDPIGYDDSTNLYAYVGNDPINQIDPLGLQSDIALNSAQPIYVVLALGPDALGLASAAAVDFILGNSISPGFEGCRGDCRNIEIKAPKITLKPKRGPALTLPFGIPGNDCGNVPTSPPGVSVDDNMRIAQYRSHHESTAAHMNDMATEFRAGGIMDYKQSGEKYTDFGNFNYGAYLIAAGFSKRSSIGFAQAYSLKTRHQWDQPRDQTMIKRGIAYAQCRLGR